MQGVSGRVRSDSFRDHFSQATMFVASQSPAERLHLTEALRFELGKVTRKAVRARMLGVLREIDPALAESVSLGIGVPVPSGPVEVPPGTSPPGPRGDNGGITASPALSLDNQPKATIATRKIAMLVADGFDGETAEHVRAKLVARGAIVEVIAPVLGLATPAQGKPVEVDKTYKTGASVFYDALLVPGGEVSASALQANGDAVHWIQEAYKHCKAIGMVGHGIELLAFAELGDAILAGEQTTDVTVDRGLVTARKRANVEEFTGAFMVAIAKHRHWDRDVDAIPA
jgi:catalase